MDDKHIELAIKNISKFGDTDIFPFTIEKHIFFDNKDDIKNILKKIDSNFFNQINNEEPINIYACAPIGYTGFRWATQIDPIWNAYYLALVISISEKIELVRIPISENQIFSYRYAPDYSVGTLFSTKINWRKFQEVSLKLLEDEKYKFILICDIADFYTRIYHHRLENEILSLPSIGDKAKRINKLLQKISNGTSYGLPIGGPASRILAELALNRTDKLLRNKGIKFTRFVDDYHIFTTSIEEAHSCLNLLAVTLLKNEGLALQKNKTNIMPRSEFIKLVSLRVKAETNDKDEKIRSKFMSLPIKYDPYSPSAEADYKKLQKELNEFDILGLLNQEIRKTRIHQQFSKRLLKAFKFITDDLVISNAFDSIFDNFDIFYPIFSQLMLSFIDNMDRINDTTKEKLVAKLHNLIKTDSYITQVELNVAYLIKAISKHQNFEGEQILNKLYEEKFPNSILVRSLVMQTMTKWKLRYWLSDKRSTFSTMNKWERKIFIIASSLLLEDEGKHWNNHNKKGFTELELIINKWSKAKANTNNWELSL